MGGRRMRKSRYLSLLLLAGVLALFEFVSRLLLPVPAFENFNRLAYSPTYSNIARGANAYLRNDSFVIASEPDAIDAVYDLNLYGFRDRDWPVVSRSHRVMFVGDSFVEGYLTDESHTIPKRFESAATQRGLRVEALNFGVTGAGLKEYMQLIYDAVPLFGPQDVVLVLYANDLPAGAFDAEGMASTPFKPSNRLRPRLLDALLRASRQERIPLAWHRPPVQYFPPVPHPGNPWSRFEKRYTFVEPRFASAMKAGRMNPFLTNEIHWYYRTLTIPVDVKPFMSTLHGFLREHGARLFVVYIPARHQVTKNYREYAKAFCAADKLHDLTGDVYQEHAATLRRTLDELQIPFMDLTAYLREREATGKRMYLRYDGHFEREAYTETGEQIFEWWSAQ